MAKLLWGNVYFQETLAGTISEESGLRCSFTYDEHYLSIKGSPIAYTMPLREASYISEQGLLPFFDNLIAEGWLEKAQSRLLGKREVTRFELLLAFGMDCAGAVSIRDPEFEALTDRLMDLDDPKELALLTHRASLSGVQPKLTLVKRGKQFYPSQVGELSTHIAKFPSAGQDNLVDNEYLSTLIMKKLLPNDPVVGLSI